MSREAYDNPEILELGRAGDVTRGTIGGGMEKCECSRPEDPDLPTDSTST